MIGRARRRPSIDRLEVDVAGQRVRVEIHGLPDLVPELGEWLGAVRVGRDDPAPWSPDVRLRRVRTGDGHLMSVEPVHPPDDPASHRSEHGDLQGVLVAVCDQLELVALRRTGAPALHAAVFGTGARGGASAAPAEALVVLGASGAGKSTMAAHLDAGGLLHGTDELALVDRCGRVTGFGRPIHLRPPSPGTGGGPAEDGARSLRGRSRFDLHRPRRTLGPDAPVAVVVVLDRDGSAVPRFAERTTAATMRGLFEHSFNLRDLPWERLGRLALLADRCVGLTLHYREAADAVGLVVGRLDEVVARTPDPIAVAAVRSGAAVAIEGRSGRFWWFPDSLLVVAGDRRKVASVGAHDVAPPGEAPAVLPPELLAELDGAFGAASW